jgi:hypothetical protein
MAFSGKRKIFVALGIFAVLALVLIGAAVTFFPSNSVTGTECFGGVVPPAGVSCPYIDAWTFLKSGVASFSVADQGPGNITLASATFSGSSNDTGFRGSLTFSLNDTTLAPNSNAAEFTSPTLQNLQVGDHITIAVRCTSGAYYTRDVVV